MTATTTIRRRTIKPVVCDCHAHGRLVYPCDLLPDGIAVRVTINGTDYLLRAHGGQPEAGYRLRKLGGDGAVYDVDVSEGYAQCDCPDATYQQRACKHSLAVVDFASKGII